MPKNPYKPGDRVRFNGTDHRDRQSMGDLGTVLAPHDSQGVDFVAVAWDNKSVDPRWNFIFLDLYAPAPDPTNYTEYYDAITEG